MSRASGGTTTSYVWDVAAGLAQVLQETTGSNTSSYVHGLGRISVTDQGGTQTYFLADGLGSTVKLVDGAGASMGDYAYDVFGAVKTHTGASTEFGFTGEQNPSAGSGQANGLEYLRARYYEPGTGRFLSRDPLGGGYPYAGGNPVNMIDPTGLYEAC